EACPPSSTYRLRKLLRKHRAGALTAAALATLLVLGAAVSTWQAIRARDAERLANRNLAKASQAVQQMLTRVAEDRLAYMPQLEEVRMNLLEDALHFYDELLLEGTVDPAIRLEAGLARLRVANLDRKLHKG